MYSGNQRTNGPNFGSSNFFSFDCHAIHHDFFSRFEFQLIWIFICCIYLLTMHSYFMYFSVKFFSALTKGHSSKSCGLYQIADAYGAKLRIEKKIHSNDDKIFRRLKKSRFCTKKGVNIICQYHLLIFHTCTPNM